MPELIVPRPSDAMPLAQEQDMLLQGALSALALSPKLIKALNQRRRERDAREEVTNERLGSTGRSMPMDPSSS